MTSEPGPPNPGLVLDLLEGFRRSKVLFAALALGVFDRLAAGADTPPRLAADLRADPDALGRLLDACVGLRLLRRDGPRYANTPAATAYLTADSPRRLTGYARYSDAVLWPLWGHLDDAVRQSSHRWQQAFGLKGPLFDHFFRTEADRREFLRGMHGLGLLSSPAVVAAFDSAASGGWPTWAGPRGTWPWPPAAATRRCGRSSSTSPPCCRWPANWSRPRAWAAGSP
jgi:acetylserotonin N-methyltransferase